MFAFGITTAAPAHTFALFWSQCLSDSVRGVSWYLTLTNLFLVIVRFAIDATPENNSLANEARILKLELDEIAVPKTRAAIIRAELDGTN